METATPLQKKDKEIAPSPFQWDNSFSSELGPGFYSFVHPTPLTKNPHFVIGSEPCAKMLGIDLDELKTTESVEGLAGIRHFEGSRPYAANYAGHQFGSFNPQLGDGRAIMLGEHRAPDGSRYEVQGDSLVSKLKGSGQTPYSRGFDGRAVLRSTIREFLCSEFMHAVGIPTTRALCMIASDDIIVREELETAAVLVRVSPSLVRFGSFEVFAHSDRPDHVKLLADYVYRESLPPGEPGDAPRSDSDPEKYVRLFECAVRSTAEMIAQWQAVGFVHGVMNTDNMSIRGDTIDYGPYAFMEAYDPYFCPNHSDTEGRYAYLNQPKIGFWNLRALAFALQSVLPQDDAIAALKQYEVFYNSAFTGLMRAKFGLRENTTENNQLFVSGLQLLRKQHVDYPTFFRLLADVPISKGDTDPVPLKRLAALFPSQSYSLPAKPLADSVARDAAAAGFETSQELNPNPEFLVWLSQYNATVLREWAASRTDEAVGNRERREAMNRVNPLYVPRIGLLQEAIEKAQKRDYSELERLFYVLQHPFEDLGEQYAKYSQPPAGSDTAHIVLSCSS